MDLFILSQDLFVTSRVEGVAKTLMLSYETAPSISHLQTSWANSPAKVLIIDLTLPKLDLKEIISWLHSQQTYVTVIAFGPHVHVKQLACAEQSGCDEVYPRGAFFSQMQNIILQSLAKYKKHARNEDQV